MARQNLIPPCYQRAEHVARKIDKEPDEIVLMLRALRNANLSLQNQREISAGLLEKLLKLDPLVERFYALYREQFPDLMIPESVVEEMDFGGTFSKIKNHRQAATARRLEVCRKTPTLMIKRKKLPQSTTSKATLGRRPVVHSTAGQRGAGPANAHHPRALNAAVVGVQFMVLLGGQFYGN